METIDVHSKSFVVKWIQIPENSTVIFQLKPIKRSINFSIYRSVTSDSYSATTVSNQNSPSLKPVPDQHLNSNSNNVESNNSSTTSLNRKRSNSVLSLEDKLKQSSMSKVHSYGSLNGNELFKSEFKVEKGGTFAFIFDNTFAKSYSKKVLFNKFFLDQSTGQEGGRPQLSSSSSSLNLPNPGQIHPNKGQYLQGYLLKKKRKKLQGFTKRFFVLNFKYNTLSYYINESSLKTRGEMPVNFSTISAFKDENTFIIDSGMEIWTLKTLNKQDWDNWTNALNFIKFNSTSSSGPNAGISSSASATPFSLNNIDSNNNNHNINKEKTTQKSNTSTFENDSHLSLIDSKIEELSSNLHELEVSNFDQKSLHDTKSQLKDLSLYVKTLISSHRTRKLQQNETSDAHRAERELSPSATSILSQEFFDAEDHEDFAIDNINDDEDEGDDDSIDNHVILLPTAHKFRNHRNPSYQVELSSSSSSNVSIEAGFKTPHIGAGGSDDEDADAYMDDDLSPLPLSPIKRRNDVPKSNTTPQSLFTFLRKNVGKDLSTISMPVTSNEPITILQKIAESFEFTHLLDEASLEPNNDIKILKIAAFSISNLSALRVKERNLRKPFNPILGETFELVREDLGYRFLAEKIHHKPQIFAVHCESNDWEISFCLNPEQKYWGKSIELINKGVVTLRLKASGEIFKWHQPSTYLKNIMAGEKYTEPSNSVSISSSIGVKALVEFKKPTGGLFSGGKSEELTIKVLADKHGVHQSNDHDYYVTGKWTENLLMKNHKDKSVEDIIWKAAPLINNYEAKYGFSVFTSNLNQITSIEDGFVPFTDSRFRPDVKAYEAGDSTSAEKLKLEVEQKQRDRRKVLADANKIHEPSFFHKVGEDDMDYEIVRGANSYWNRRKEQNWENLTKLW